MANNEIFIPSFNKSGNLDLETEINKAVGTVLNDTVNPENKASYNYSDDSEEAALDKTYIIDNSYDLSSAALDPESFNMSVEELAASIFSISQLEKSESGYDASLDEKLKDTESISSQTQLEQFLETLDNGVRDSIVTAVNTLFDSITDLIGSNIPQLNGLFGILAGIGAVINDGLVNYKDGISETAFGNNMEMSWYGSTQSFLNYFNKKYANVAEANRKINFLNSTPLDGGEARDSLFGTLIMGCPYLFNQYADPGNRTLINSFIKDGRFITLTPGLPKYNGLTSYQGAKENSILYQTETPEKMLNYLLKNGLDKSFMEKDKRYYTFKTDFEDYFAYLETMLNAVWIKLGLAKNGEQFNLFTFFNIKSPTEGGIAPDGASTLRSRYNSSIGFFCNAASSLSESISNSNTGVGQELASRANANADDYQKINYLTGMGGGGSGKNLARTTAIQVRNIKQVKNLFSESFTDTAEAISTFKAGEGVWGLIRGAYSALKVAGGLISDISRFETEQDKAAILQSFATTNGMKVVYPELWADSTYSKNVNFNFSFISPYGDPLSIFKYVYVPFLSLLCFAMPRQAAENGYVSPFFVRADVPGLFTSDLALISDISWTKGGGSALWTKDGLPRAIDVSITLSDLYPYLSMTKRLSYLSANPSYAVFLDSFSGQLALNDGSNDDIINEYFRGMIDRVSGNNVDAMWNKFNTTKQRAVKDFNMRSRGSATGAISRYSIPWVHNSSI